MAGHLSRESLLAHLRDGDERALGARIVDAAEAALSREQPVATDFLDPAAQRVAEGILASIPDVSYKAFGGYVRAERRRYSVYPHYFLTELVVDPVGALEIEVAGGAGTLSHRDVLGAILGTGLTREKVGDILMTPKGAQAIVAVEVMPFLELHLTQVGRERVAVRPIDLERLEVEPEQVKEIRATVASMRLDAVASSGFGMSRSKMVREIKAERLKVNWQPVTNPARAVEVGDVISMRGRGRVIVEAVSGTTRKGRTGLILKRLI